MPRFAVAFQCLCLAKGCILLLLLNIYIVVVLWGWPGPRNKNLIHCKFWIILLAESVCSELNEISVGGSAYDHVVNYRLYLNAYFVGSAEGCVVILYSVTYYSVNALFSHLNDYFEYALACYKCRFSRLIYVKNLFFVIIRVIWGFSLVVLPSCFCTSFPYSAGMPCTWWDGS